MNAETIVPAPSLFQKFLILSGLKAPFAYICTYLLEPICDRILDRLDPPAMYPTLVESVRRVSQETGIQSFPFMLSEREKCQTCGKWVLMFVEPEHTCFECWPDADGDTIPGLGSFSEPMGSSR